MEDVGWLDLGWCLFGAAFWVTAWLSLGDPLALAPPPWGKVNSAVKEVEPAGGLVCRGGGAWADWLQCLPWLRQQWQECAGCCPSLPGSPGHSIPGWERRQLPPLPSVSLSVCLSGSACFISLPASSIHPSACLPAYQPDPPRRVWITQAEKPQPSRWG